MWCNTAISTIAKLGIVKGRFAERFDPNASITRTDISAHWAEAEIERAASLGWISGYGDGTFRPDQYITHAEAMTMINRVLCRIPENESDMLDGMKTWPDNNSGVLLGGSRSCQHEYVRKDGSTRPGLPDGRPGRITVLRLRPVRGHERG